MAPRNRKTPEAEGGSKPEEKPLTAGMTRISARLAETGEASSLAVQPALEKANPPRKKAGKANKAQPKLEPAANGKGEELVEEKSEKGKIVEGKKLDPQYSVQYEARSIGSLKCERLANLIGCCCDGDERLVVAVSMPNDTCRYRNSNYSCSHSAHLAQTGEAPLAVQPAPEKAKPPRKKAGNANTAHLENERETKYRESILSLVQTSMATNLTSSAFPF